MSKKKAPFIAMKAGEEEAMLFALACFAANLTSDDVDSMSIDAREWLAMSIGLSAEQYRAGCAFLAAYQKKYRHSLAVLHAGYERAVFDEPGPARLQ